MEKDSDLLIVFATGKSRRVTNVVEYGVCENSDRCLYFVTEDGKRSFVPMYGVTYFGEWFLHLT